MEAVLGLPPPERRWAWLSPTGPPGAPSSPTPSSSGASLGIYVGIGKGSGRAQVGRRAGGAGGGRERHARHRPAPPPRLHLPLARRAAQWCLGAGLGLLPALQPGRVRSEAHALMPRCASRPGGWRGAGAGSDRWGGDLPQIPQAAAAGAAGGGAAAAAQPRWALHRAFAGAGGIGATTVQWRLHCPA